ncbi:MAG: HPr family phosphocarrier protein [Chthoniobacteraceae bacterium]
MQHLRLEKGDYILRRDRRLVLGHEWVVAQSSLDSRRCDLMLPSSMRREVEILNELGLHARPAAEFVRAVQEFKSEITIRKGDGGDVFSAGSILEVLTANLDCGSRMTIEAVGPDAAAALDRLAELLVEFRMQEERESK